MTKKTELFDPYRKFTLDIPGGQKKTTTLA